MADSRLTEPSCASGSGDEQASDEPASDTIALAMEARKHQGSFENEVSFNGECDLHLHLSKCEKNPGHPTFIPVKTFTKYNLPLRYQDDDLVGCITALADLTVRIVCRFVSSHRPDTYPGNDKPYPFYDSRGKKMMRCGTGWILYVNREPCSTQKSCPCQECRDSFKPQTRYVEVEIRTSAHNIYDLSEAKHAACDLFYDEGNLPGSEVIKFTSGSMTHMERDFDGDMCDLTYVTHDMDLADTLEQTVARYEQLHLTVSRRYTTNQSNAENITNQSNVENITNQSNDTNLSNKKSDDCTHSESVHKLTVIVSHPHGCSKQITVGEYVKINRMECRDSLTQYVYNTATCRGSSGAPVFVLDRSLLWLLCEHPHSGSFDENSYNYSGFALS